MEGFLHLFAPGGAPHAPARGAPPGVLFIEDFDPHPEPREASPTPPAPPPPVPVPRADHEAALAAAYDEGRRAGLAEAGAEEAALQAALRTDALARIADALVASREAAREAARQTAESLAESAFALLAAALPDLAARHAVPETAAFVRGVLGPLHRAPELRVDVPADLVADITALLEPALAAHEGAVTVTSAAGLAPGEARVRWADGQARRDLARLWDEIAAALAPFALPGSAALGAQLLATEP